MNKLIKQIIESKFNFNIDIEDNEMKSSLSKSKYNSVSLKQLYLNLQYIVDLGLPSKTIWCRYNLGVDLFKLNKPEDWYGDYYAWGEIKPKDLYALETYKFGKTFYIEKYNNKDNLKELLLEDDTAYLNLHIGNLKFRIPTKELFEELLEYTNNEWVENYNNINGLNGKIFKSKTNDNEIFIPAAGYRYNSVLIDAEAFLWSSSLNIDIDCALNFYFDFEQPIMSYHVRWRGMPIRPVLYAN